MDLLYSQVALLDKYKRMSPDNAMQQIKKLLNIVLCPEVQKHIGKEKNISMYT